jgi:hypothetical protein
MTHTHTHYYIHTHILHHANKQRNTTQAGDAQHTHIHTSHAVTHIHIRAHTLSTVPCSPEQETLLFYFNNLLFSLSHFTFPLTVKTHADTHRRRHTHDLEGGWRGEPIEVACVYGDTRTYDTCHVVVRTPRGVYVTRAGIVPNLPVPLLIGRDCPIFNHIQHMRDQPRRPGRTARPAYGARLAPSTPAESSAEDGGTEGDGPTPPGTPAHSTGGSHQVESVGPPLDTPDTLTATEQTGPQGGSESSHLTEFSDFFPTGGGGENGSTRVEQHPRP